MKIREYINRPENLLTIGVFSVLTLFPAVEIFTRLLGRPGIPASPILVQHMTLWIGFIGAVIAARSNRLLSVVREPVFNSTNKVGLTQFFVHVVSLSVVFVLSVSYLSLIHI